MSLDAAGMNKENSNGDLVGESAPWYRIPSRTFVSVEHPCFVKNARMAVDTLGGHTSVRATLDPERRDRPVRLSLCPEDNGRSQISSVSTKTDNVLLRITVPKRTGRKRKRGSNDTFEEDSSVGSVRRDARYMLRSVLDNKDNSEIEAVGAIERTHVFRSMPDFFYSTENDSVMSEVKAKILPLHYPSVKEFKVDLATRHNINANLIPPPILSNYQIPATYSYRQNPAVKRTVDPESKLAVTTNTASRDKVYTHQMQYDMETAPTEPDPTAPAPETQGANFEGVVALLRHIFASRPIWTRRALLNQFPTESPRFLVRLAIAYVAYAMRSGPWRDTYIRFGVDPRSDPSYRVYQTLLLQLVVSRREGTDRRPEYLRTWKPSDSKISHVFPQKPPFPRDGKAWQLIDLMEDSQLKALIETPEIRNYCEPRYFGWYKNGTIAKLKVVLKSKAESLMTGEEPDPAMYSKFLELPDEYTPGGGEVDTTTTGNKDIASTSTPADGPQNDDPVAGYLPKDSTKQQLEWAALYRSMCRTALGSKPKSARLTKSKPQTRSGYLGDGTAEDEDMDGRYQQAEQAESGGEDKDSEDAETRLELDVELEDEGEEDAVEDLIEEEEDVAEEDPNSG